MTDDAYCRWLGRFFRIAGMEPDDIYQEARLAMWLAPGAERIAAYRRIVELLRRSQRGGRPTFCELHDTEGTADVVDIVAARERLRSLRTVSLTELERAALGRVLQGQTCTAKQLDNALQRARRKLAAA